MDITGKALNQGYSTSDSDKLVFDLAGLPAGTYLIYFEISKRKPTSTL